MCRYGKNRDFQGFYGIDSIGGIVPEDGMENKRECGKIPNRELVHKQFLIDKRMAKTNRML